MAVQLRHLAEPAWRGGDEHRVRIYELGERHGPHLHRQPELASRVQQGRATNAGQQPVDRRRDQHAAGEMRHVGVRASPTRPSCATSSASSKPAARARRRPWKPWKWLVSLCSRSR